MLHRNLHNKHAVAAHRFFFHLLLRMEVLTHCGGGVASYGLANFVIRRWIRGQERMERKGWFPGMKCFVCCLVMDWGGISNKSFDYVEKLSLLRYVCNVDKSQKCWAMVMSVGSDPVEHSDLISQNGLIFVVSSSYPSQKLGKGLSLIKHAYVRLWIVGVGSTMH